MQQALVVRVGWKPLKVNIIKKDKKENSVNKLLFYNRTLIKYINNSKTERKKRLSTR